MCFLRISWKTCENGINIDQKSTTNRSESIKNLPKFYPEGVWGSFGLIWAPQIRFGTDLDTTWGSTWGRFRGQVGVMLAQKLILGGPGWHSKATMMFDTFLTRFETDFGSISGSKMEPKSVQDRSQERS